MNIAKTVLIVIISALMVRTAKAIRQNEQAGGLCTEMQSATIANGEMMIFFCQHVRLTSHQNFQR
jgi:hypothetical protein